MDILLDYGADPFIHRNDGSTPIDLLIGDETDKENDPPRE